MRKVLLRITASSMEAIRTLTWAYRCTTDIIQKVDDGFTCNIDLNEHEYLWLENAMHFGKHPEVKAQKIV